ncbi:Serine proteinase inhibitor 2 [Halotydeus destructor]|nr:Serine proteinase inhibitor 2 [Halotydeus destructor]
MERVRRVEFISAINAFGYRVLKQLKPDVSSVVSGPSFATILALLHNGASGETLAQVRSIYLKNHIPDATVGHPEIHHLVCNEEAFSLSHTTRILLADDLNIDESYSEFVKNMGLKLERVNFQHDSQQIVKDVNRWVSEVTSSEAVNALEKVSPSAQMMLVNTVAFKDFWKIPFTTCESRIFNNKPTPPEAFITTEGLYAVHEMEGFAVVRIPYETFTGSLYAILPGKDLGTADLKFKLLNLLIEKVFAVEPRYIKLSLPMFKVDKSFNVARLLQTFGVTDAFDSEMASFSRISSDKMCIADVTQRIAFSINNYAAPAASGNDDEPTEAWIFDRPFIFIVRDDQTDMHYITGVVQNLRLE